LKTRLISDYHLLQSYLNTLDVRAVNLCLDFNVFKCHTKFSYRSRTYFEFKYLLRGIYLTIENNTVNDIGVLYDDSNLTFHAHIDAPRAVKL